jgi:peptidoglycan/LPS O-acetylase OafA/YrhL
MAMYVAFPLFCAIGHFRRALPLLLGLVVLALSLAALRFGLGSASVEAWTGPDLHPYLRALPSFLIGVGLWFLREPLKRIPAPRALLLVAILALFAAMLTPQPAPLILALAYLTTVLAISSDLNGAAHPIVRAVAPLGQLTYSVYMWHPLIIMLVLAAVGDRLPTAGSLPLAGLALATYVAILGWSYLSFTLIETPARRWVDGAPPFGRRPGGRSAAPAPITLNHLWPSRSRARC